MRTFLVMLCISLLAGCSSLRNLFSQDGSYSGISPPPLHTVDKELSRDSPIKDVLESIKKASADPYIDYYLALENARTSGAEQNPDAIKKYVNAGITVVNVSCLRWFKALAESEIRFNFAQSNQNVIQDLGTTALGLGKANPIAVGAYGAGFTAINGLEKSFSQSFFLAPNSNKVKSHVFSALDSRAIELREKLDQKTFPQVYLELERYADICTQQTAKEIINSSLDQTQTSVSEKEGGKVKTTITDQQTANAALKNEIEKEKASATREKDEQIKSLAESQKTLQAEKQQLSDKVYVLQQATTAAQKLADLQRSNSELQKNNADLLATTALLQKKIDELSTAK